MFAIPERTLFADDDTNKPPSKAAVKERITVDLRARSIGGTLPFDTRFELTGKIPDTVDRVDLRFAECPRGECPAVSMDPEGCGADLPKAAAWRPPLDQ